MISGMYDARKEAKEYLEFYANPEEDGKLEEYKKIITEEPKFPYYTSMVKLTLVQQDEWEDYFNQYKMECEAKRENIRTTDAEIDRLVYALYGLTEDEIAIVEGTKK